MKQLRRVARGGCWRISPFHPKIFNLLGFLRKKSENLGSNPLLVKKFFNLRGKIQNISVPPPPCKKIRRSHKMTKIFAFPSQFPPKLTGPIAHQENQLSSAFALLIHKTIVIIVMFLIGKILLANYRRKNNM